MALTNEAYFELRELLDVLHSGPSAEVAVYTLEGCSTTIKIGPVSDVSLLHMFGELPGVRRLSLSCNSFGGWEAEYALAGDEVLQALKRYKPIAERKRRVRAALRLESESKTPTILGGAKSSMWIGNFDSPEDAESFRRKLQSAGCRVRVIGSDISVEDPWLKAYLTEFTEEPSDKGAEEKQPDAVNHPSHYASDSGLEAIEVIEAFFHGNAFLANTFKYIARAGKKGGETKRLEDLRKARWYLEREIKREEAHEDS